MHFVLTFLGVELTLVKSVSCVVQRSEALGIGLRSLFIFPLLRKIGLLELRVVVRVSTN